MKLQTYPVMILFLILISTNLSASRMISTPKEQKLNPGAKAPYKGILIPEYNYRFYQGILVRMRETDRKLYDTKKELENIKKDKARNERIYNYILVFLSGGLVYQSLR